MGRIERLLPFVAQTAARAGGVSAGSRCLDLL